MICSPSMSRAFLLRLSAPLLLAAAMLAPSRSAPTAWYKGNLHTHTTNSDGDSPPEEVAAWYKQAGYNFLALSDHNVFTAPRPLNEKLAEPGRFLLLPAEEVTDKFGAKPVHVNAYNLAELIKPAGGASLIETIQRNVNAIRAAKALPSVNHPNFGWAITSRDLLQVENLPFLEVYNGHPMVNNLGGGGAESLDAMWDALLTAGKRVWGIAVDDAHHYKKWGRQYSNPGRGWVMVRAASLEREAIFRALEAGDFYASTGVELEDVRTGGAEYVVEVKPAGTARYAITFLGAGGKTLARVEAARGAFPLKGQRYVRARVDDSNGNTAWTQPVFLK